ncbi:MAG TPA: hypothetical protein VMS93_02835 [Candidatus Saccharimonadales bacterium]|nr:hypothetical protein [Candidatus Saccharimonadales bacterium]
MTVYATEALDMPAVNAPAEKLEFGAIPQMEQPGPRNPEATYACA